MKVDNYKNYNDKRRKTIDYVKNYLIQIKSESKLLSTEYINNSTKLLFQCKCGKVFERNFSNIQQRKSCMCVSCGKKKGWKENRKPSTFSEDIVKEFLKYGYKVLQENPIEHIKDKILVEDSNGYRGYINIENARKEKHFSIFSVRFNEENILYNLNHYCEQNNFGTKVVNYWKDGRYIRIECVCQCGKIYNSNVGDFTTQNRVFCKECTKHQSRFERIVKAELQANDIKFEEQKRFDNCRSDITNYLLPFDFYLYENNILIEVDGQGHYEPSRFRGITQEKAEETYNKTIYNDNIKNKFCQLNNIKLIRISYEDINNQNYKNIIQTITM